MITLQCFLKFECEKDKKEVLNLMRAFSSCMRFAFKRLLEKRERKDLKKELQKIFHLNSRYCDDAIKKADAVINACRETGQNPGKVIFGGRSLFEKLCKKHLTGKARSVLYRKWREKRQGTLYSRGDKSKQGNLNLRFVNLNNEWFLRINTGERKWVFAKVIRKVSREKDKWIDFIWKLTEAELTGNWFPYSVELKLRNGKIYAMVSFEEESPEKVITRDYGVIGIDLNVSPHHIAWAEISEDGNLMSSGKISLSELYGKSKNQRDYIIWQKAYEVVNIAFEKGRAIAIEGLKKVSKGRRGDGRAGLRKKLHNWVYKSLIEKVKVLAERKGIQVVEINPAYTSIIGVLKYSPLYLIDKDTASAFVIGRRALGFKEFLPKHYEELLRNADFLTYSIFKLEERYQELKERVRKERNVYRKRALRSDLKEIQGNIDTLRKHIEGLHKSLECELEPQHVPVNLWKEQVRGLGKAPGQKLWQVLKAATVIPLLGKSFVRDFSPLRNILITGDWKRVAGEQVPVPGAGASVPELKNTLVQFY